MKDIVVSTLTPAERINLWASLTKYMITKGEVEASTLRTTLKEIEEGG